MFLFSLLISFVDFLCADMLCGIFLKRKECGRTRKWMFLFSAALILTLCNMLQTMPLNPLVYMLLQLVVLRLLFAATFPIQAALAIFMVALSGILEVFAYQFHLFFRYTSLVPLASGSFNPELIGATVLSKLLLILLYAYFSFFLKRKPIRLQTKDPSACCYCQSPQSLYAIWPFTCNSRSHPLFSIKYFVPPSPY